LWNRATLWPLPCSKKCSGADVFSFWTHRSWRRGDSWSSPPLVARLF
jgi:hypothetical protein